MALLILITLSPLVMTQTVTAMQGPSTWMIDTTQPDKYARVTPGTRQVFNPTLSVTKFKMEETGCLTRYKGIGSTTIIPDSAITGMISELSNYPPSKYIRLTNTGIEGWMMKTLPSWVEIDLGVNFRLFSVLTRGGAYLGSYNGPHTYQLHYRLAASPYVTYQENNATRIFTSHPVGGPAWNTIVTNELAHPVIGRMFKVEVLTAVQSYPAIRVELVGCDCEPGPEVAVVRQEGRLHLREVSELTDNDTATCTTIEQSHVTIFIPVPVIVHDNVTVTAISKRDPSCPPYTAQELYPMVKLTPPFRTLRGAFGKCQFWESSEQSELSIQAYNCTCLLGVCEGIYIKLNPPCPLQLCDVYVV